MITNNRFTVSTRTFAYGLGVEIISGPEWELINEALKTKQMPHNRKKGLLGIILGTITNNEAYVERVLLKKNEKLSVDKEELLQSIEDDFNEVEENLREASELRIKADQIQQKALKKHKKNMLKYIEYG